MTEPAPVLLGRVRAPNNDANKKRISAPQEPAAPAVVPRGDARRRMFRGQTWPWALDLDPAPDAVEQPRVCVFTYV